MSAAFWVRPRVRHVGQRDQAIEAVEQHSTPRRYRTVDRRELLVGSFRMRLHRHRHCVCALKSTLFMVVAVAIQHDGPWKEAYERGRAKKCVYDERTRRYKGTTKVIGKLAGQMLSIIYGLLKQDTELLRTIPAGHPPPPLQIYDPRAHEQHRHGMYQPMKPRPATIVQLPARGT